MAIEFFSDKITFGNFSLKLTDSGMEVINLTNNAAGKLYATDFQGFGSFQGTVAGFNSGGYIPVNQVQNTIDKFPFTSDTNATDVGDITVARGSVAGTSSTESGYTSGGTSNSNVIDKFPFANNKNATDVGNLTQGRYRVSGQSSSISGYASGGEPGPSNVIDKFPFATDTNATDVGNLTTDKQFTAGISSSLFGYNAGGGPPSVYNNTIDKFPFSTDTNATDVGDLTFVRRGSTGNSSTTHGYASGGSIGGDPSTYTNTIDKFPFAADTNSTDVADVLTSRATAAGTNSTTHGYQSGGFQNTPTDPNQIEKFPFATDTNASDVGDLTQGRNQPAGTQF